MRSQEPAKQRLNRKLRGQLHQLEERAIQEQEELTDHTKGRLMNFIQEAQELARGADRPRENAMQTGALDYGHLVPAEKRMCAFL
jgi:hypothetical protein